MKKLIFLILGVVSFGFGQVSTGIFRYQTQFIRPTNSTAYTAGDVVADSTTGGSDALKFAVSSRHGKIIAARMEADTANTTNATFRLFFFGDSAGLGRLADNGAFTPTSTKTYDSLSIGYVNFTLQAAGTASSQVISHYITSTNVDVPYRLLAGTGAQSSAIWGVLTATGAWTPSHNSKIRLTIWVDQR